MSKFPNNAEYQLPRVTMHVIEMIKRNINSYTSLRIIYSGLGTISHGGHNFYLDIGPNWTKRRESKLIQGLGGLRSEE